MLSSIISQVCAQSWVKKLTVRYTVSQELYHIFAFLHSGLQKNVVFYPDGKRGRVADKDCVKIYNFFASLVKGGGPP